MAALLLRVMLVTAGLGAVEIGLGGVLTAGSPMGWLLILIGLVLLIGGTATFMTPLLTRSRNDGGAS